jgi:hypothetical protein
VLTDPFFQEQRLMTQTFDSSVTQHGDAQAMPGSEAEHLLQERYGTVGGQTAQLKRKGIISDWTSIGPPTRPQEDKRMLDHSLPEGSVSHSTFWSRTLFAENVVTAHSPAPVARSSSTTERRSWVDDRFEGHLPSESAEGPEVLAERLNSLSSPGRSCPLRRHLVENPNILVGSAGSARNDRRRDFRHANLPSCRR